MDTEILEENEMRPVNMEKEEKLKSNKISRRDSKHVEALGSRTFAIVSEDLIAPFPLESIFFLYSCLALFFTLILIPMHNSILSPMFGGVNLMLPSLATP